MIQKIISGGQTGADRAALDVAIKHNIHYGGWVPKGRKTEDGPLPEMYQLQEMPTGSYSARTEKNILDSDGTLIVSHGKLTGGSALTKDFAQKHSKPWIHINFMATGFPDARQNIIEWIDANRIQILNVAGARASKDPDIYRGTFELLEMVFSVQS